MQKDTTHTVLVALKSTRNHSICIWTHIATLPFFHSPTQTSCIIIYNCKPSILIILQYQNKVHFFSLQLASGKDYFGVIFKPNMISGFVPLLKVKMMQSSLSSLCFKGPNCDWYKLMSLLSTDFRHVKRSSFLIQVHQVRFNVVSQLDGTDHFTLANNSHRRSLQQSDPVSV